MMGQGRGWSIYHNYSRRVWNRFIRMFIHGKKKKKSPQICILICEKAAKKCEIMEKVVLKINK